MRAAARLDPAALAGILLGASLVQAWLAGRLDLLLAPAFHLLVAGAGALLVAASGAALVQSWRRPRPLRRPRQTALLALVALLVMLLPPRPSFSLLVANRSSAALEGLTAGFALPPAERSLVDWARLWRSAPDPAGFLGEEVRISGFVLERPDGSRSLARLVVRCCLADATPVDLAVRWPEQPPAVDAWLEVSGVVGAGPEGLEVVAASVRPIPRPSQPFDT
ncbi:TIGR03943 family protein [Synechococcus sp. RSCCF101]|nr:TIGR03943 family protein [Synechococcus sp. RSCCF101]